MNTTANGQRFASETSFIAACFLAAFLLITLFGAASTRWAGYSQEENDRAFRVLDLLRHGGPFDRAHLGDLPHRHGIVGVAARLPWALVALPFRPAVPLPESPVEISFARNDLAAEAILSLAPQVETALLGAVIAAWIVRTTGSRRKALLWSFAAIFSTTLWSYAYIGMETVPALTLLAAAFLAIGPTRLRGRRRAAAFAFALACTLSAKSISLLLLPLGAWLAWRSVTRSAREDGMGRAGGLLVSAAAVLALRIPSELAMRSYLLRHPIFGGRTPAEELQIMLVDSPLAWAGHLHGLLFSANKGLLVFAPLVLLALWRSASGAVADRDVARLALGVMASLALPLALLSIWTDETWGPRYLCPAIAPAFLALALSSPGEGPGRKLREALVPIAAACGFAVNLLGVLVPYGELPAVASAVEPTTLATFQTDLRWNHPAFNLRLFEAWIANERDPARGALFRNPSSAWPSEQWNLYRPRTVRLGRLATPQPAVLRVLVSGEERRLVPFAWALVAAGLAGGLLFAQLLRASRGEAARAS